MYIFFLKINLFQTNTYLQFSQCSTFLFVLSKALDKPIRKQFTRFTFSANFLCLLELSLLPCCVSLLVDNQESFLFYIYSRLFRRYVWVFNKGLKINNLKDERIKLGSEPFGRPIIMICSVDFFSACLNFS